VTRLIGQWRTVLAVVVITGVAAGVAVRLHDGSPERSATGFCAALAEARDLDEGLASLDPTRLDPQVAALARAAAVAPEDIAPSVATVRGLVDDLTETIEAAPRDRARAVEDVLRASDLAAAQAAGAAVEGYARDVCGLPLAGAT
jgi:hypothetical protein